MNLSKVVTVICTWGLSAKPEHQIIFESNNIFSENITADPNGKLYNCVVKSLKK